MMGGEMDTIMVFGLAGVAAASAAAPGPCILLVASRAANRGLSSGLRVVLGISAGKSILLACSWAMILGTLTLPDAALEAMRLGGLVLLVALSLAMLNTKSAPQVAAPIGGRQRLGDTLLGLVLSLSSPLSLLFIFAILPQFVDIQRLDAAGVAVASGAILTGGVLPFLATCFFAARAFESVPHLAAPINRACGVGLLGFVGLSVVVGS